MPTVAPDGAGPRTSWPRWALAALLLLGFAAFYALGLYQYVSWDYLRAHLDALHSQVRQNLPAALLIFFLAYTAATALSLPAAAVLTLAAGALFGRWLGTGVVGLASTAGATLAFLSSRYLFRDFARRRFGGRLAALDRGVEKDGAFYLFTLRLVPVFPFFLVNLGMGLTRIPVRTFVWVSLLGMLPGTFLYANAGAALAAIDSPGKILSPTVFASLALLGVAPLILRWLVRRKGHPVADAPAGPPQLSDDRGAPAALPLRADDPDDARLAANVRPAHWVNPTPAARYNLVVIGAGPAGLVAAAGAAGLGAKVALVERGLMGGDCLNVGCVPSKALLAAASAAAAVRNAGRFGVHVPDGVRVDFAEVMGRVRRLRADLSATDSAERFRALGVDVFLGEGRFAGPDTVEVAGRTLRFRKAVIATGASPRTPAIPGLVETGYLTNETVFTLTALPPRLAVIGAGPVGCELAQAFARLGAKVWLLDARPRILPRDDVEAAAVVERALRRDGVELVLGCSVAGVARRSDGKVIALKGDPAREILANEILVAAGRRPNVDGLGLEAAGIGCDARGGVAVDDYLRTSNRRVYAAGDVCSHYPFTHAADAAARIVLQNALFYGRARASALTIPWCTYTDPELAHVGLSEAGAKERGIPVRTFMQPLREVDRAVLDDEAEGFVKVLVREGTDRIVGATVVASHAGEVISELTLSMAGRLGLGVLGKTIHPYPTRAAALKKLGDSYDRTRLTPLVKGLFDRWMAWTR